MDRDGFFVCTVWLVWFTRIIAEADTLKMLAKKRITNISHTKLYELWICYQEELQVLATITVFNNDNVFRHKCQLTNVLNQS